MRPTIVYLLHNKHYSTGLSCSMTASVGGTDMVNGPICDVAISCCCSKSRTCMHAVTDPNTQAAPGSILTGQKGWWRAAHIVRAVYPSRVEVAAAIITAATDMQSHIRSQLALIEEYNSDRWRRRRRRRVAAAAAAAAAAAVRE